MDMRSAPVTRLVALALLVIAISWPGVAFAHTELVTSSPALGAEVSTSTDRIQLVFGTELAPVGNDVVVRDPDGDDVTSGDALTLRDTLEVQVDLIEPGRHTVSYRFVGQDGHPVTGHLWFTAVAASAPLSATAVQLGATRPPDARAGTAAAGDATAWLLPLAGLAGALVLLYSAAAARQRAHADGPGRS